MSSAAQATTPLERSIAAGWAALEDQRRTRLTALQTRPPARPSLAWPEPKPRPLTTFSSSLRVSPPPSGEDVDDRKALVAAVNDLRESIDATGAGAGQQAERPLSRTESPAEMVIHAAAAAQSALRDTLADEKAVRAQMRRDEAELISLRSAFEAGRDERERAVASLADAEEELMAQDLHCAQMTNELRMVHEAAAAAAVERAELRRLLRQRMEVLADRDEVEASSRSSTPRAVQMAASARQAVQRSREAAAERDAARAEAADLRKEYALLHRLASSQLGDLAKEVVGATSRELKLREQLMEAGTLLISTHVALGTTNAKEAPKLAEIEQRLVQLAFEPLPKAPNLEPLPNETPQVPHSATRAGGGRRGLPLSTAPEAVALAEEEEAAVAAFAGISPTAPAREGESGNEMSFLRSIDANLTGRAYVDERAAAALATHETLVASGTSMLRSYPGALGTPIGSGAVSGPGSYARSETERVRRASAREERQKKRVAQEAAATAVAAMGEEMAAARDEIAAERRRMEESIESVRAAAKAEVTTTLQDEIAVMRDDAARQMAELTEMRTHLTDATATSARLSEELIKERTQVEGVVAERAAEAARLAAEAEAARSEAAGGSELVQPRAELDLELDLVTAKLEAVTAELIEARGAAERAYADGLAARSPAKSQAAAGKQSASSSIAASPTRPFSSAPTSASPAKNPPSTSPAAKAALSGAPSPRYPASILPPGSPASPSRAVAAAAAAVAALGPGASPAGDDYLSAYYATSAPEASAEQVEAAVEAAAADDVASVLAVLEASRALEDEDAELSERLAGAMFDGTRAARQLSKASDDLRAAHSSASAEFNLAKASDGASALVAERRAAELSSALGEAERAADEAKAEAAITVAGLEAKVAALQDELSKQFERAEKAEAAAPGAGPPKATSEGSRELDTESRDSDELDAARARVGTLTRQVASLNDELAEAVSDVKAARERGDDLERLSAAGSKREERLRNEMATLERRLEAAEAEVAHVTVKLKEALSPPLTEAEVPVPAVAHATVTLKSAHSATRLEINELRQLKDAPALPLSVPQPHPTPVAAPALTSTKGGAPSRVTLTPVAATPVAATPVAATPVARLAARPALLPTASSSAASGGGDSDLESLEELVDEVVNLDELPITQPPPLPPESAAAAVAPAPSVPPISAVLATESPSDKMPSPHRREDDYYMERAREIKAKKDAAAAEASAASFREGGGFGVGDDDALSIGSMSDDGELELPGF